MNGNFFEIGSITNAMKAKDVLRKHGIMSRIRRIADFTDRKGCGYGLHVPGNAELALPLLLDAGVRIKNGSSGFSEREMSL